MRPVRILCDENLPRFLERALERHHEKAQKKRFDLLKVGDPGAPPKRTSDPELLLWCEREERLLLTCDRKTMPRHHANHLAAGHHSWGVLLVRRDAPTGATLESLFELLGASTAEDWSDTVDFIPFRPLLQRLRP